MSDVEKVAQQHPENQQHTIESDIDVNHFQLEKFEYLVNTDDAETASRQLLFLLEKLDGHYGMWGDTFSAYVPGVKSSDVNRYICTRIAGAVTTLFSRPGFNISDAGFVRLMGLHRWLALIFSVSNYRHADHIIRNINAAGGGCIDPLTLNSENLRLFCLCYFPDSEISLQPDGLWQYDRETVVRLFFALLSSRVLPTPAAHSKRELLLAWLPEKLKELDSLAFLPTMVLHDVYMHCSYADLPAKHKIKHSINTLVRCTLLKEGYQDRYTFPVSDSQLVKTPVGTDKPVMLVVLEWFTCQHSVYRTHSEGFRALRQHFTVHGVALESAIDDTSASVFDVCHRLKSDDAFADALALVDKLKPEVVYYSGIGMFPYTIWLSNLRLAPLQLVGLGHGASTFCDQIDGFVVEEDFVGDKACFSESVIAMPVDSMPFVPPARIEQTPAVRTPFDQRRMQALSNGKVLPLRIAVCASVMKINPGFIETLAEISRRSRIPVQFCFYIGFAQGLTFNYLEETIQAVLPNAEVNAHLPVQEYQNALNSCEFFISPFPYGNMNGIVDAVRRGLPGVCLSGPEVHTHIDEGLFRRMGLPESMIAHDIESYIRAVVKMAEDDTWRESLQKQLAENDVEAVLFSGKPEKFADRIRDIYLSHS